MAQVATSGKSGPKFTPRVEQHLVERVAVGGELGGQGIEWNIIKHDRDENFTLPRGQLVIHGAPQRSEQFPHPMDAEADNAQAGIELRDLRYFAAVAEELHFGRAATRLYISQPGLSKAIARLERELQVQLLTRTHSSVELTEAGTELLDHARGLLAGLDEAVTRVRMAGRGEAGLVRVGVALLAEPAVAPALNAFQE